VLSVSSTKTGLTETYQYSAEGLRTVVQEYSGATLQMTRVNLYNDARQLVSQYEKTAAGSLTWRRDILYLGTREAAEIDSAGMHVTQVDHLGSPRLVTGPTGAVESRQKYLPFGELLEQSGPFKSAKGYTNHEQTDSSGLIYMQARFYVPWLGRFASPDPARDQHFEQTQSWNIYSYVRNSPVMSTDPTGMVTKEEAKKNAKATKGAGSTVSGAESYSPAFENDGKESVQTNSTSPSPSSKFLGLIVGSSETSIPGGPDPSTSAGPRGSKDNPLPAVGLGAVVEVVAPMPTRQESLGAYHSMLDDINRRQLIAVRPYAKKLSVALVGFGLGAAGATKAVPKAPGYTLGAFLVSSSLAAAAAEDMKAEIVKIVAPFAAERKELNELFSKILKDNQG
jgi:RHS repeat-associated protein